MICLHISQPQEHMKPTIKLESGKHKEQEMVCLQRKEALRRNVAALSDYAMCMAVCESYTRDMKKVAFAT